MKHKWRRWVMLASAVVMIGAQCLGLLWPAAVTGLRIVSLAAMLVLALCVGLVWSDIRTLRYPADRDIDKRT